MEASPSKPTDRIFSDGILAQCIAKSIAVADDHHSEVSTVALAVQHMCLANFDMAVAMNTRGLSNDEKQTFLQRAAVSELPAITQMIIAERAAQKQS
jgi:hypothetical protein